MIMEWLKDKTKRYAVMERAVTEGLAQQIKALRESRGMTQRQFAELLGLHQTQVSKYETAEGLRNVTLQTLLNIAEKCDVALLVRFIGWNDWLKAYLPFLPVDSYSDEAIDLYITPFGVFQGAGI